VIVCALGQISEKTIKEQEKRTGGSKIIIG